MKPTRVLVIRIGRLGDTILATPVIEALQQYYGETVLVDFVTSTGASALILGMDKRVNHVYPVEHRRLNWRLHATKREIEEHSRAKPYDLVINLECGSECDDFIRFVSHEHFLGRPLIAPAHLPNRHCVDTEKTIYSDYLGSELVVSCETSLELDGEPEPLSVSPGEDFVMINPGFSGLGSNGYRSHRGWPESHWHELVMKITQQMRVPVLINGTNDELPYFSELLSIEGVHSLFGSSLLTLAYALSNARFLVSVDTGTMHLAAALGTRVIALFGPGNPLLTGPYSTKGLHRILTSGLECQPCVRSALEKKCGFNRCMSDLKPCEVFENVQHLFAS